jgi:hypothetical protein
MLFGCKPKIPQKEEIDDEDYDFIANSMIQEVNIVKDKLRSAQDQIN